jgi:hypothetical protein
VGLSAFAIGTLLVLLVELYRRRKPHLAKSAPH